MNFGELFTAFSQLNATSSHLATCGIDNRFLGCTQGDALPWLPEVPWGGAWQAGTTRRRCHWKRVQLVVGQRGAASALLRPVASLVRSCGAAHLPAHPQAAAVPCESIAKDVL